VIEPSSSVRITRRQPCSKVTSRPGGRGCAILAEIRGCEKCCRRGLLSHLMDAHGWECRCHNRLEPVANHTGPSASASPWSAVTRPTILASIFSNSGIERGMRIGIVARRDAAGGMGRMNRTFDWLVVAFLAGHVLIIRAVPQKATDASHPSLRAKAKQFHYLGRERMDGSSLCSSQ